MVPLSNHCVKQMSVNHPWHLSLPHLLSSHLNKSSRFYLLYFFNSVYFLPYLMMTCWSKLPLCPSWNTAQALNCFLHVPFCPFNLFRARVNFKQHAYRQPPSRLLWFTMWLAAKARIIHSKLQVPYALAKYAFSLTRHMYVCLLLIYSLKVSHAPFTSCFLSVINVTYISSPFLKMPFLSFNYSFP